MIYCVCYEYFIYGVCDVSSKVLDTLDKGEDCPNEGQEEVAKHETLVEAATKKDEDALGLLNAAKNAEVNFGSYSIASLQSMDCSAMFQDASYLAAKKTRSDAESVCITTEAELKEAKTDYDSAVANAKHAKLVCQCNVKALYAREWDLVEKDKPKRDAAWKKAKLLEVSARSLLQNQMFPCMRTTLNATAECRTSRRLMYDDWLLHD